jgi:hypothetical protein
MSKQSYLKRQKQFFRPIFAIHREHHFQNFATFNRRNIGSDVLAEHELEKFWICGSTSTLPRKGFFQNQAFPGNGTTRSETFWGGRGRCFLTAWNGWQ